MNKAAIGLLRQRLSSKARVSWRPPSTGLWGIPTSRSHVAKAASTAASVRWSISSFRQSNAFCSTNTTGEPSQSATNLHADGEEPDETEGEMLLARSEAEEYIVEWEEEEDAEPVMGDGGAGGGLVLGDVGWGERVLNVAREVLDQHLPEDLVMFAFKVSPRGYIYVRLDKLTNKYGCPSIDEIQSFNTLYKKKVDELVESGEIPLDLAIQVSSPGADRLLKVPADLDRFKDMPMIVRYLEDSGSGRRQEMSGVFMVESIDRAAGQCVWKLADVKENKGKAGKGRPLSRKQKDWRLHLSFDAMESVTLY